MTKIVNSFIYAFIFIFLLFSRDTINIFFKYFCGGYHTSTLLKAFYSPTPAVPRKGKAPSATLLRTGCAVSASVGRRGLRPKPGPFLSGFLLFLTVFLHALQEPVSALSVLRRLSARTDSLGKTPALVCLRRCPPYAG